MNKTNKQTKLAKCKNQEGSSYRILWIQISNFQTQILQNRSPLDLAFVSLILHIFGSSKWSREFPHPPFIGQGGQNERWVRGLPFPKENEMAGRRGCVTLTPASSPVSKTDIVFIHVSPLLDVSGSGKE